MLAVQAAQRGEFEAARYLLEQALTAISAHVRA